MPGWPSVTLLPNLISFLLAFGLAIYALTRPRTPGALAYALLAFIQGLWMLGLQLELVSQGLGEKLFWDNWQWAMALASMPTILWLALSVTGQRLRPLYWALIWTPILVFYGLLLTNPLHQLIYSDARIVPEPPFSAFNYSYGGPIWTILIYLYGLTIGAIILLARYLPQTRGRHTTQIRLIILGIGLPLLFHIVVFAVGTHNVDRRDTVPLTIGLSNLILAWAIFRWRLFDVPSLARDRLIDSMNDGMAVVDLDDRIIDVNRTARRVARQHLAPFIGQPVSSVFPAWRQEIERYRDVEELHTEITLSAKDGKLHYFDFQIQPIRDNNGQLIARMFTAHNISRVKQTEIDLRISERLYRGLFEQSNDAVFIIAQDRRHLRVNQRAADMLGYTREELLALDYRQIVVEDRHKMSQNVYQKMLAGEIIPVYETQFCHKDGSIIPVEVNVQAIRDEDGQLVHFQSIARNITERKQAEENLLKRDVLLQIAAQASQLLLSDYDMDAAIPSILEMVGEIADQDRAYIFEAHQDEETGDHLASQRYEWVRDGVIPQINNPELQNLPFEVLSGWYEDLSGGYYIEGRPDEFPDSVREILERQGIKTLLVVPIHVDNQFWGFIGFDNCQVSYPWSISERSILTTIATALGAAIVRKRSERIIQHSEARYRSILAAMSEGVVLHNQHGEIILCNDAAPAILGTTRERLIGLTPQQTTSRTIHEDGTPFAAEEYPALVSLRTGTPQTDIIMGVRRVEEDRIIWISLNSQPLMDTDRGEKPYGVVVTFTDITEQRKARQHEFDLALQRERLNILSSFIRDAAHEFRTPLAIINSSVYNLANRNEAERRPYYQEKVEQQIKRITDLLDMLLLNTRLDTSITLKESRISLKPLLRMTGDHVAQRYGSKQLHFIFEMEDPVAHVAGDVDLLEDAFLFILDNAARYTTHGGTVTIRLKNGDDCVLIDFEDTGTGIAEEDLPHIFEHFWRKDAAHSVAGFGLGLPVAQRIIELHDGQIEVSSEPGRGTCVRVMLPTLPEP